MKQNVVQGSPRILAAWIKTSRLPLAFSCPIYSRSLGAQGTLVLVIPRQHVVNERLLGLKPGIGKVNAQVCSLPHSDVDACNKNEPLPKRIFSPTLILDHPFQRLLDDLLQARPSTSMPLRATAISLWL